ncbi:hypothetical protein QR680_010946 [Steinernema hermaphroditum]|uniref:Uncharacterized protein n=1 Tax=Steinernema hermaphroditum TaxID=289476 RepID=A0AA39IRS8_9BILA|nr:hypothetical protein QR680_010946 [Steinernema hermaphroditum]
MSKNASCDLKTRRVGSHKDVLPPKRRIEVAVSDRIPKKTMGARSIMAVLACFVVSASAYTEILTKEDQYQYERYLWCPTKFVGAMCPENDLFSYHLCCGDLNQKCCSHTRVWVMILLGVVGVGTVVGLIALAVRLLTLRRRRGKSTANYTPGQPQPHFDTPKRPGSRV